MYIFCVCLIWRLLLALYFAIRRFMSIEPFVDFGPKFCDLTSLMRHYLKKKHYVFFSFVDVCPLHCPTNVENMSHVVSISASSFIYYKKSMLSIIYYV